MIVMQELLERMRMYDSQEEAKRSFIVEKLVERPENIVRRKKCV